VQPLARPDAGKDDLDVATGVSTMVRRFVELGADGLAMRIDWTGSGISEVGIERKTGRIVVEVDRAFFARPTWWRRSVTPAARAGSWACSRRSTSRIS
jgi:GDP-D-mannose dehydratase